MEFLISKLITCTFFLWASIHLSSFGPPLIEKTGTSSYRNLSGYRSSEKHCYILLWYTCRCILVCWIGLYGVDYIQKKVCNFKASEASLKFSLFWIIFFIISGILVPLRRYYLKVLHRAHNTLQLVATSISLKLL